MHEIARKRETNMNLRKNYICTRLNTRKKHKDMRKNCIHVCMRLNMRIIIPDMRKMHMDMRLII